MIHTTIMFRIAIRRFVLCPVPTVAGCRVPTKFSAESLTALRRTYNTLMCDDNPESPPNPLPSVSLVNTTKLCPNEIAQKTDVFVKTLIKQLDCTPLQAHRILKSVPILLDNPHAVNTVCKFLFKHGVNQTAIIENPFLLLQSPGKLSEKIVHLKLQSPRDLNDLIPLLRASAKRLSNVRILTCKEAKIFPQGHRIYYLAERLNVEPKIVAKHVSTHLFMLDMLADQLIENLDVQLKYNVASINILRDPWAFRYSTKSIDGRLGRAADGYKDKIMPWMVRCTESILAKSIKHSVDEKELLGDRTLVEYVAERLGFDVDMTRVILDKHKAIYTVRVTKIKNILDYFLNESEYTATDIAQTPRILCHSLTTTKTRLAELRELGCKPSSLVIVCRSANEYRKFLDSWKAKQERLKQRTSPKQSPRPIDENSSPES